MSKGKLPFRFSIEQALVVLLTVVCIMLGWQNYQLKHRGMGSGKAPPMLEAGEIVPAIRFIASDGSLDSLTFQDMTDEVYVLAVMRPSCPGCEVALPFWEDMVWKLPSGSRLLGLSVGSHADVEGMMLDVNSFIDVGILDDPKGFVDTYKAHGVPTTIAVTDGGMVLGAWMGPQDKGLQEEILSTVREYVVTDQNAIAHG